MRSDIHLAPKKSERTRSVGSGMVSRRRFIAGAAGVTGSIAIGLLWRSMSDQGHSAVTGGFTVPVLKEIILELVSTAENSTKKWTSSYAYIEDIDDGRGYTAGVVGWCSGTGDMLDLVERYTATTPGNPLQKYLPACALRQSARSVSHLARPRFHHRLGRRRRHCQLPGCPT